MRDFPAEVPAVQRAVEHLHHCQATFREVVPVVERFEGKAVWEGEVHVFNLIGHPTASVCYAWASLVEGSKNKKFYAVLHIPPVTSPIEAVRASIIRDFRKDQGSNTWTCKSGHKHPPEPVTAAKWNQTEPRGERPVHCPDCGQANRPDKKSENWETYESEEDIRRVIEKRRSHTCLNK